MVVYDNAAGRKMYRLKKVIRHYINSNLYVSFLDTIVNVEYFTYQYWTKLNLKGAFFFQTYFYSLENREKEEPYEEKAIIINILGEKKCIIRQKHVYIGMNILFLINIFQTILLTKLHL